MLLRLTQVLEAKTLTSLREIADDASLFEDGRKTAGRAARPVKNNLQLAGGARQQTAARMVETALRANAMFLSAARPKHFARILISRCETGMGYGTHIDDPVINGQRTDLSFTLFLTPPGAYDGGELVLEGHDGETAIKLEAGDLILYPTTVLHRVEPVTRGVRLAAVGWVRSLIRLDAYREILFDLDLSAQDVFDREGKSPLYDRLSKTKSNLIRLWAED